MQHWLLQPPSRSTRSSDSAVKRAVPRTGAASAGGLPTCLQPCRSSSHSCVAKPTHSAFVQLLCPCRLRCAAPGLLAQERSNAQRCASPSFAKSAQARAAVTSEAQAQQRQLANVRKHIVGVVSAAVCLQAHQLCQCGECVRCNTWNCHAADGHIIRWLGTGSAGARCWNMISMPGSFAAPSGCDTSRLRKLVSGRRLEQRMDSASCYRSRFRPACSR